MPLKKKMLQIITLSEIGGAQNILYHIVAGLDPALFDITVACAPGGELVGWLGKLGYVRVIEIPELKRNISPLNDFRALRKLYSLIREEKFDIVHCHSSKAGFLGRLAAWLAGVPRIIFTVHGWGLNQKWPARVAFIWAEKLAGMISTDVVCVSGADYDRAIKMRLVNPEKLRIIYNGLPEVVPGEGLRHELVLTPEDFVVGMVARLASPKDPLFFLELASELLRNKDYQHVRFVLVGDGPLKEQCHNFIEKNGMERNVFLLGSRENAAALYWDMDVAVLFSKWEGLPLAVIEAMLAAKPVIASAVGGIGELVKNNENGFLIKPGDMAGAIEALTLLLTDENMRLNMGQASIRIARSNFALTNMQKEYRDLFA